MKIPVILNDTQTVLEADPSETLVKVLRNLGYVSVKHGCNTASCGACQVLLDGKAVASCHIPVGIIKDCSITTLEHFSKSDIYSSIIKGFDRAGITLCGYCNAGKIFAAYEVLTTIVQPTREKIAQITNTRQKSQSRRRRPPRKRPAADQKTRRYDGGLYARRSGIERRAMNCRLRDVN